MVVEYDSESRIEVEVESMEVCGGSRWSVSLSSNSRLDSLLDKRI
jgi:hypothetical protein